MIHIRNFKETLSPGKFKIIDNEQGLTLLEVLVSFLILSLVVVTMLGRFAQAGRQNAEDYHYNEALSLAQSKMEDIKKKNFDSVVNVTTATDFSKESDYAQFQGLKYKVAVVPNYIMVNSVSRLYTKTVTVSVYYSDEEIDKQLDLTAEVARR